MSAYGNDCHFYYNSTCTKGDNCAFRHCVAAKDCKMTCSFWQQGICSKPNCPYRHVELPPETRNRQAIPCYWENQPAGCSRPNCQYQHFKPRPLVQGAQSIPTQPLVSEAHLPDTSVPPPLYRQVTQTPVSQAVMPIPGAPVIQPVVVQLSDSEVESEKNSPVKHKTALSSAQTVTTSNLAMTTQAPQKLAVNTVSQTTSNVSRPVSVQLPDLDYFIGKPFKNKTDRSPLLSPTRYDGSPDRRSYDSRYSGSRSPSPRNRSLSPRRRWSRSPSPRRSRSPRRRSPYLRDRSRSPRRWSPRRSPSPRRRTPPRNQISRPQDRYLQSNRPVYDRYNRERDIPSTSYSRGQDQPGRGQERPNQTVAIVPKKISLSKIKDNTDSDDDKIKVKSLEEIQRAKALLSMGLIELKSGKIVKVGDVQKHKEHEDEEKHKSEQPKKKKLVKKSTSKMKTVEKKVKPKQKKTVVKTKTKKEDKKQEVKTVENPEEVQQEDEVEEEHFDEEDDLGEEPEIDICEAAEEFEEPDSQEKEDTEDEDVEDTEEESKESEQEESEEPEREESEELEQEESESEPEPEPVRQDIRRAVVRNDTRETKLTPQQKRKRKVIVDEFEVKKNEKKAKVSVQSRLGRKLDSTEIKENRKQSSDNIKTVKSQLKLKRDKSSEKVGSSNTGTVKIGGIKSRLGLSGNISTKVDNSFGKSEPKKIVLKRTIETTKENEDRTEVVKKRRWNKGSAKSRLGEVGSDTNVTDSDLKKIVITRNIDTENIPRSDVSLHKQQERQSQSSFQESKNQVQSTLSRINKIIESKKESKEQTQSDSGDRKKDWNKLSVWSSRVSECIAAVKPTKKESEIDLYDSSSNDSISVESIRLTKDQKRKKDPKQERALYVPPARKRTVTSYEDQEELKVSPLKKSLKAQEEKKKEPETIKTYSQIMEEKRKKLEKQREKKAKAEEKSKKRKLSRLSLGDKENEKVPEEPKISIETSQLPPIKADVPVPKSSLLDTFSFSLSETTTPSQSDKVDSTTEHMDLLLEPDYAEKEPKDSLETSPTKKISDDNWLEFSNEDLDMTGCDTADDDDLLREIDELLA